MKRILSLIILSFGVFLSIEAETYEIKALSTETITIGNEHDNKVGDTFEDPKKIVWEDNNQSMIVQAKSTGKLLRFSKKVFESKGIIESISEYFSDYFLRTKKASSRGLEASPMFRKSPVASSFPERRIALVIGNSNYDALPFLRNANKDASDIAETLISLGFDVMENYETTFEEMKTALDQFTTRASAYDVALFYYAGHGLQEEGVNYLIPVENSLDFKHNSLLHSLNCDDVMDRMNNAGTPSKIIFLDACRNSNQSWSRSSAQGLARMEGSVGSVIVFATQSGNIALDGDGDNSPFALSLIKNIRRENVSFNDAISGIVKDTYSITNRKQYPLPIGSLIHDFAFNPTGSQSKPISGNPQPIAPVYTKATSTISPTDLSSLSPEQLYNLGCEAYNREEYPEAFKFLRQAVDKKHTEAITKFGDLYYYGQGVEKDFDLAAYYYGIAAQNGDIEAQYKLGFCYEHGQGVGQSNAEAIKWYKPAANSGHVKAQCYQGTILLFDENYKDIKEGIKWIRKSADKGFKYAQRVLGFCHEIGHGVKQDFSRAIVLYKLAAEQNDEYSAYRLGEIYEAGEITGLDIPKAIKFYTQSAENELVDAQVHLGKLYYTGRLVDKNYPEARKWFQKAADSGHSDAQNYLGCIYLSGYGVDKNIETALHWFNLSADQGNVKAITNIGYLYELGEGVDKDLQAAAVYYKIAAEKGYGNAQCYLGNCYYDGNGVDKNYDLAFQWYTKSVESGFTFGNIKIGVCYFYGTGIGKNYSEALKHFKIAAENGHREAYYNLGIMYEGDEYGCKDIGEARKWYEMAAASGDKKAQERLKNL